MNNNRSKNYSLDDNHSVILKSRFDEVVLLFHTWSQFWNFYSHWNIGSLSNGVLHVNFFLQETSMIFPSPCVWKKFGRGAWEEKTLLLCNKNNFYARNWRLLVPRRPHLVRVTFYGMAGISSPPPPPEQKQRYLPRKSFWPHFDTSHNFTKTSPDNLSVVLTFKYALIPPSWKNSPKFSNGFVEFNKTMRGILTSLLWYSLSFSEGFEWVNR